MTNKKKAAWHSAAASKKNKDFKTNYSVRAIPKIAIVRLAIWGVIPASLAQWLIQRGGLRHD